MPRRQFTSTKKKSDDHAGQRRLTVVAPSLFDNRSRRCRSTLVTLPWLLTVLQDCDLPWHAMPVGNWMHRQLELGMLPDAGWATWPVHWLVCRNMLHKPKVLACFFVTLWSGPDHMPFVLSPRQVIMHDVGCQVPSTKHAEPPY